MIQMFLICSYRGPKPNSGAGHLGELGADSLTILVGEGSAMIEAIPGCARTRRLLMQEADRLERLAQDMRLIAGEVGPAAADLETAPVIDGWELSWRPMTTLIGTLVGHPRLADGPAHTTEIWAIDLAHRWARTLSRYYALGAMGRGGTPWLTTLQSTRHHSWTAQPASNVWLASWLRLPPPGGGCSAAEHDSAGKWWWRPKRLMTKPRSDPGGRFP